MATPPDAATPRIFIARHAERKAFARTGEYDLELHYQGETSGAPFWDDALTGMGTRQAQALARELPEGAVRRIVASDWIRCVQTAVVVAQELGISTVEVDGALGEFEHKAWFAGTGRRPRCLNASMEELQAIVDAMLVQTLSSVRLVAAHNKLPDPRTSDDWEEDENPRPAGIAAAILKTGAVAMDGTLIVTHGGVGRKIAQALTSRDPGEVAFAAWCAIELASAATDDGAASTVANDAAASRTTATLSRVFSAPLEVTAAQRWAGGQTANWRRWFGAEGARLGLDGAVRVLELGSWEGLSMTFWLRELAAHHKDSLVVCADHFDDMETPVGVARRQRVLANARIHGQLANKLRLLPHFTLPALMQLLNDATTADSGTSVVDTGFNLVYVDADHTARGTLLDALLAWRLLRPGGYMLFDDYEWPVQSRKYPHNPPSLDHPDHPSSGIDAFLSLAGHELEIVSKSYQLLVRKSETCAGVNVGFPLTSATAVLPVVIVLDQETAEAGLAALAALNEEAAAAGRQLEIVVLVEAITGDQLQQSIRESQRPLGARITWVKLDVGKLIGLDGAMRRIYLALHVGQVCPGRYEHALMVVPETGRAAGWAKAAVQLWRQRPVEATVAIAPSVLPCVAVLRPHKLGDAHAASLTLRYELLDAEREHGWLGLLQRVLPAGECQEVTLQ